MEKFSQLINQEAISSHLQRAIQTGKVSHAYIFSGGKGSGKRSMAELFAKTLQCEKKGIEPCNQCHSCHQADSHNHPDIRIVTHEKPTSISVDEIRTQVVGDMAIRPFQGPYKIYIIPDAQLLVPEAQNALLKTIEEPPVYGIVMLLTTSEEALLETVRSRCVKLAMRPVSDEQIVAYLRRTQDISSRKASFAAAFAGGCLGQAIHIAQSEDFTLMLNSVLDLVLHLSGMDAPDMMTAIQTIEKNWKLVIDDYLDTMAMWYRDVLVMKSTQNPNRVIFTEHLPELKEQAAGSTYNGLQEIFKALETAKMRLKANVNFQLTLELLFLTIREKVSV